MASSFPHLQTQHYMNLTTYRRSGVPVTTPVWFAEEGERLYVYTQANAGKVKRIRHSSNVEVGPCDRVGRPLGPSQVASARLLDPNDGKRADRLLTRKYGWLKRLISLVAKVRGSAPAYLEIRIR
jgi:uncharacterized protein